MCYFYQKTIDRRYLTKNLKVPAASELKEITSHLKQPTRNRLKVR